MLSLLVGEHDGVYYNKRYFKCPDMHGIIVPIEQVHILTPRDVSDICSTYIVCVMEAHYYVRDETCGY